MWGGVALEAGGILPSRVDARGSLPRASDSSFNIHAAAFCQTASSRPRSAGTGRQQLLREVTGLWERQLPPAPREGASCAEASGSPSAKPRLGGFFPGFSPFRVPLLPEQCLDPRRGSGFSPVWLLRGDLAVEEHSASPRRGEVPLLGEDGDFPALCCCQEPVGLSGC